MDADPAPAGASPVEDNPTAAAADAADLQQVENAEAHVLTSLLGAQSAAQPPLLEHQDPAAAQPLSKSEDQRIPNQLAGILLSGPNQRGQAEANRPQQGHDAQMQRSTTPRSLQPTEPCGQAGQNGAAPALGQPVAVTQMVPAGVMPVQTAPALQQATGNTAAVDRSAVPVPRDPAGDVAAVSKHGAIPTAASLRMHGGSVSAAAQQLASSVPLPQAIPAQVCMFLCSPSVGGCNVKA